MNRHAGLTVRYSESRPTYKSWTYRPFDGDPTWDRLPHKTKAAVLNEATIIDANGQTITGKPRQKIVDRLLIDTESMPTIFDPTAEDAVTRPYIPGLWNHDTVPSLPGPKGWGKTKLLCRELAPALIIPGRRFLEAFEPAEMTESERSRDVWMINSETRPSAVHEELIAAGLVYTYRDGVPVYVSAEFGLDAGALIVEHLPKTGGATRFDVSDLAKIPWWEDRLVRFTGRHAPPLTLLVDGVTAIVANDTGRYGAFTSGLKQLMQEAGIPNGLGVLHSPMDPRTLMPMGGIESAGQWDGQWFIRADRFPIFSNTPRYLRTAPRLGDEEVPERRVVLRQDGGLTLLPSATRAERPEEAPVDTERERLLRKLTEADDWVWTKTLCGTGDAYKSGSKLLNVMESEGVVESRQHQDGRTRGTQWRLTAV